MIYGLIPAAGKSVRMGRPKLSLPVGGRTVLECAVANLQAAGVDTILIVLGSQTKDLSLSAEEAGARVLVLPADTADMRSTVEHGFDWFELQCQPASDDVVVLAPADLPMLDPSVARLLLQQFRTTPGRTMAVPVHLGRRGHPILFSWKHVAGIRVWKRDEGIDRYMRAHSPETLEVSVSTKRILQDLDTPEEYEALCREIESQSNTTLRMSM